MQAAPLSVTCVTELSKERLVLYNAKRINIVFTFLFIIYVAGYFYSFIIFSSRTYVQKVITEIDYLQVKYSKRLTMI